MIHSCSNCKQSFNEEADYLAHTCPATGFTPQQAQHLGEDFAFVQKAALERGLEQLSSSNAPEDTLLKQQTAIDQVS